MWQFIISGYIPGTTVQITFEIFLLFSLSTASAFALWLLARHYHLTRQDARRLLLEKIEHIHNISL